MPADRAIATDRDIQSAFRDVWAYFGPTSTPSKDLATLSETDLVSKGPVSQGLTFRFHCGDPETNKVEQKPDWGLVRFIQDGRATSLDGKDWRISITLDHPNPRMRDSSGRPLRGTLNFKAHLVQPLPTPDNWPK
jgi:hypothetical protein